MRVEELKAGKLYYIYNGVDNKVSRSGGTITIIGGTGGATTGTGGTITLQGGSCTGNNGISLIGVASGSGMGVSQNVEQWNKTVKANLRRQKEKIIKNSVIGMFIKTLEPTFENGYYARHEFLVGKETIYLSSHTVEDYVLSLTNNIKGKQ